MSEVLWVGLGMTMAYVSLVVYAVLLERRIGRERRRGEQS